MVFSKIIAPAALGLCAALTLLVVTPTALMAAPGASASHSDAAGRGGDAGSQGGQNGGRQSNSSPAHGGQHESSGRAGQTAGSVLESLGLSIGPAQPRQVSATRQIEQSQRQAKPRKSSAKTAVMPFKQIEILARKGNLYAKWRMAKLYERSLVFPKNPVKAFRLYNEIFKAYRSANLYSSKTRFIQETLISIAGYYQTGLPGAGVKKNPRRAYSILKHVALYGHPRAQYLLGQMKLRGEGTKPNRKQGMRWLNLAAQKKNAAAQAELGRLYTSKKITRTDRAKGLMWLGLARGNEQNTETRKTVSRLYDSLLVKANREERDRAENLTLGWQQRFGSSQ